jgi:hypothetical protein
MNLEVKELWLSALRSGEYVQGKNLLHKSFPDTDKPDEFCCLGVLCDLAVKNGVIDESDIQTLEVQEDGYSYHGYEHSTAFLPGSVQHWSGVHSDNGVFHDSQFDIERSLVFLNDDGIPFSDIADVIEKEF